MWSVYLALDGKLAFQTGHAKSSDKIKTCWKVNNMQWSLGTGATLAENSYDIFFQYIRSYPALIYARFVTFLDTVNMARSCVSNEELIPSIR